MKKVLSVLLVLALALTLTACGGSGSSSGSSRSTSSRKCAYKENGRSVCSRSAASGSNFCSYHQGYLDSIYESLVGN